MANEPLYTYVVAGAKGIIVDGELYKAGRDINLTAAQAAQLADRLEAQNTPRAITPELTPEQQEEKARAEAKVITASGKVEESQKEKEKESDASRRSKN